MTKWKIKTSPFTVIFFCVAMLHMALLILQWNNAPAKEKQSRLVVKLRPDYFKNKKQIVQSSESESDKKMDDAYLSDKNRFFERETKARVVDKFQSSSSSGGSSKAGKKKVKLSDLGMMASEDPYKQAAEKYTKEKKGDTGSDPNPKVSATSDYLKDVPLGDLTQLNTTEYKYYGFYYRIKQKLEQFWGRSLHEKAKDMVTQGRKVASAENFITALEITLDHEGEIIAIKVTGGSGIRELDDAAIDSFNQAGPFPNPPKGMVEDGKVKLEWGFVVKS